MIRQGWIDAGEAMAVVQQYVLAGVCRATLYAQHKPPVVDAVNCLGQGYGDHPFRGGKCRKAYQRERRGRLEGKRGPKPLAAQREPDRLYSEIGKLKVELDWLKKKSGISLP